MGQNEMMQAKNMYAQLLTMLDERGWKYSRFDDDMVISATISTDDFPVEFIVKIDEERSLVRYMSSLPFKVPEEKIIDMAMAVCYVNNIMIDGTFDLNIMDGSISFRMVDSFASGTKLSDDTLERILILSSSMIDAYNDKFFMIIKGMTTVDQFIESEENK